MRVTLFLLFFCIAVVNATGTLINLTSSDIGSLESQTEATIDEGEFIISSIGASGSGVLQRWYGVQDDNDADQIEFGYNYDNGSGNNLPFDQKVGGVQEPEVHIGDLFVVDYGGATYYEFVLDTNENDGLVSLDTFQLFAYTDPYSSPLVTDRSDLNLLGDLVYDMDATHDYSILVEETGSGSGSTDLTVLVSTDVFAGYSPDSKVYLFSEFGNVGALEVNGDVLNFGVSDGFEEWGFRKNINYSPVPEASTVVTGSVLCLSLFVFAYIRRRK